MPFSRSTNFILALSLFFAIAGFAEDAQDSFNGRQEFFCWQELCQNSSFGRQTSQSATDQDFETALTGAI